MVVVVEELTGEDVVVELEDEEVVEVVNEEEVVEMVDWVAKKKQKKKSGDGLQRRAC